MFNVNQNLIDKYDAAESDSERVRISCTFSRNLINDNQDDLLMDAMEKCAEFCEAKTNNEAVKAVQEDTLSYLMRMDKEMNAILPSLQVVRADTFRLKKMLEG